MQNINNWRPTKYILRQNTLIANPDPSEVSPGSRFIANIMAHFCQKTINQYAVGHLLDLGCGKVPFFQIYRKLVKSNICVDWDNSPHGNQYIDINQDLNKRLRLDENTFDTVLLIDVLEHIAEPKQLLSEIGRVLKPGGKLILGVPFYYRLHEEPYDFHRYTRYGLEWYCKVAKIKPIEMTSVGGTPEIFFDLVAKHIYKSKVLSVLWLKLAELCMKLKPLKYMSELTKDKFPLAYVMVAQK